MKRHAARRLKPFRNCCISKPNIQPLVRAPSTTRPAFYCSRSRLNWFVQTCQTRLSLHFNRINWKVYRFDRQCDRIPQRNSRTSDGSGWKIHQHVFHFNKENKVNLLVLSITKLCTRCKKPILCGKLIRTHQYHTI